MRVVQLARGRERRVALVEEPRLRWLEADSLYQLAWQAACEDLPLRDLILSRATGESADYDLIDSGEGEWRLLPCADHPEEPARCLVSGTGLTHASSAKNRQAMHTAAAELTDSMKMYLWGVEQGRLRDGAPGIAPEWFYKGPGSILRAHLEPLAVPAHAEDGGEEAEIAGVYLIDPAGRPRRIGMAQGNEFSDHVHERRNYLYLAESKLRQCAIGPELCLDPDFSDVTGEASIHRGGGVLWRQEIHSGQAAMSHELANLEHHHFKHAQHLRPGDVHVHFYGADAFSFGAGVRLEAGDVMQVSFRGFGRPLRNPLVVEPGPAPLIRVEGL